MSPKPTPHFIEQDSPDVIQQRRRELNDASRQYEDMLFGLRDAVAAGNWHELSKGQQAALLDGVDILLELEGIESPYQAGEHPTSENES